MAIATVVTPELYKLFSTAQVQDMIRSLRCDRIVPFKYFYQGNLIPHWQALNTKQAEAQISSAKADDNFLKRVCIRLLQSERSCDRWNIIDIGAGNPQLVKKFVGTFLENNLLNAYIALDISPDILEMSRQDLTGWLPNLNWQGVQWDFEQSSMPEQVMSQRASKTAASETENRETETIENLYLYIGSTFCNVIDRLAVLRNIAAGLKADEYLYVSFSVDFAAAKPQNFEVDEHISKPAALTLLGWLGIKAEDTEILGYFDPEWGGYKTDIQLRADYDVAFKVHGQTEIVSLKAGERINIYRFFSYRIEADTSAPQIFADFQAAGLEIISYRIEPLLSRVMLVCRLLGSRASE
ncbi:MAG: L-histidine N(alpha)-methyltransferase [Cyanobacteria bacterium P01_G01_bin.54]